jgi:hypothetical protein
VRDLTPLPPAEHPPLLVEVGFPRACRRAASPWRRGVPIDTCTNALSLSLIVGEAVALVADVVATKSTARSSAVPTVIVRLNPKILHMPTVCCRAWHGPRIPIRPFGATCKAFIWRAHTWASSGRFARASERNRA